MWGEEVGMWGCRREVVLRVAVYVCVARLRAHESAGFSVHDQLTE
eukprot:COSAG03_NODE_26641_length_258_cov_0.522013_2_plen_44_part_01